MPERRHFHHATGLEEIIRCKLLDKEMITAPLTREHEALVQRIFDTRTEAGYGFTFEPDAPAPRQPPAALHERDCHRVADHDAYMPTLFARYETLDNVSVDPNDDDRRTVGACQNIMADESVARCMEALVRREKDVSGGVAEIQVHAGKNVDMDVIGDKVGRIHVGKQDLSQLQTRKMKGLKRSRDVADDEAAFAGTEDEGVLDAGKRVRVEVEV